MMTAAAECLADMLTMIALYTTHCTAACSSGGGAGSSRMPVPKRSRTEGKMSPLPQPPRGTHKERGGGRGGVGGRGVTTCNNDQCV